MIMALGAFHSQPHPDIPGGFYPIHYIFNPEFLSNDSSLIGGGMVAIKTGGDFLIIRGIREKIAGQLFDRKPVEGHIVLVCVQDPVPPGPHISGAIIMKDGSVPIAGGIHPYESHTLSVSIRVKQSVDQTLEGIGRLVFYEAIDLGRGGR